MTTQKRALTSHDRRLRNRRHRVALMSCVLCLACEKPSPKYRVPSTESTKPAPAATSQESAKANPAAIGLPEGPCQQAIACEDAEPLFEPYIEAQGRVICFTDEVAQCECAEELNAEYSRCDGEY